MGLYVIAMIGVEDILNWAMVILGLGLVIFVHELGHFLVAKACGVKCEKFFVGFDIGGWKISKKWGETEYGIGILPLGGYVKMLGQDDNPYRLREEMERARNAQEDPGPPEPIGAPQGNQPAGSQPAGNAPAEQELSAENKEAIFDPRSYLAQSIPERMAIISAGVIMNVIFAFIFAAIAYSIGVTTPPCVVGGVFPGEAAWQANLRPGDKIVQIGDQKTTRFLDLNHAVAFGNAGEGLSIQIVKPGETESRTIEVAPEHREGSPIPRIGISGPSTTTLALTLPDSPANGTEPPLARGDRIVAVDGTQVKTYPELLAIFVKNPSQPLKLTVERDVADKPSETLEVTVAANPMRRLGLVMAMGKVTAIQVDSPAAKAGLKPGDFITKITPENQKDLTLDPVLLPEELRRRAGQRVDITVTRDGNQSVELPNVQLREVTWEEDPMAEGQPVSAPALGIAYRVLNRVQDVLPDSPAAASGKFKPQDEITEIQFLPPPPTEGEEPLFKEKSFELSSDKPNWPVAFTYLQMVPTSGVKLWIKGQDEPVELTPETVDGWDLADRGLRYQPLEFKIQAESASEAMRLAAWQTSENLTMVVKFLRRISTLWPAAGGPLSIFRAGASQAERGISSLLLFLAMLSANLAVINILPIPILDGGHLVFLTLEGIRGKPVSERVFHLVTIIGFAFILTLMVLVSGLDIHHLSR